MITRKYRNDSKCGGRVFYVFGKNHEHKCEAVTFVGGNVYSDNAEELAREMEVPTLMRRSALDKGPGLCGAHYMISLPPKESLTVAEWRDVLDTTMSALGYDKNYKYFGVIHEDTTKQHMHIVANRTSMDNHLLINESKDYETLMDAARDLEIKYKANLSVTPNPEKTWGVNHVERDITKFGREVKQYKEELKAGRTPEKKPELLWRNTLIARVATAIEEVHESAKKKSTTHKPILPTMTQFVNALKKKNVDVEFTTKKGTEEIVGISYIFQGKKISGRNLKKSRLTFQKLTDQEGISYDKIDLRKLQRSIQTRTIESKDEQHERKLAIRRVGGNIPSGVAYDRSIGANSEVDKDSVYTWGKRLKKREPKKRDEYFAIRVQMAQYHYSIARRMMPPTRFNGHHMYFAFKKPYVEIKLEIDTNNIVRLMTQMMRTLQVFFDVFKAHYELLADFEYNSETDGPTYQRESDGNPDQFQRIGYSDAPVRFTNKDVLTLEIGANIETIRPTLA